jgi:lipoprotein-anchoring transpeptidase ErfK/SrfK
LVGILGLGLIVGVGIYSVFHFLKSKPTPEQTALANDAPAHIVNIDNATTRPASAVAETPATRPAALAAVAIAPAAQVPALSSAQILAQGKAKLDVGELLAGRQILNDALNAGTFAPADAASAKNEISRANQTIIFSPRLFADDVYGGTYTVPPGGVLIRIAKNFNLTSEMLCRVNSLSDARKLRAAQVIKVVQGPFYAVVTKSSFTIDMYLGGVAGEKSAMYVTTFSVGLGKDNSTPNGNWIVEPGHKLTHPIYYSPRGGGVIPADDPKNPLGNYWIGLAGTEGQAVGQASYGIHGTIEPDSIGKQASMGCIRLRNDDIAMVYEMLVEGKSAIVVKD